MRRTFRLTWSMRGHGNHEKFWSAGVIFHLFWYQVGIAWICHVQQGMCGVWTSGVGSYTACLYRTGYYKASEVAYGTHKSCQVPDCVKERVLLFGKHSLHLFNTPWRFPAEEFAGQCEGFFYLGTLDLCIEAFHQLQDTNSSFGYRNLSVD